MTGSDLCDCLTWVSDLSGTGLPSGLFGNLLSVRWRRKGLRLKSEEGVGCSHGLLLGWPQHSYTIMDKLY